MDIGTQPALTARARWPRRTVAALAAGCTLCAVPVPAAAAGALPAQPRIVSAGVTRTALGPAGGTVRLRVDLEHAQRCRITTLWPPAVTVVYSHNPTTACRSGHYSPRITIGPNATGSVRTVAVRIVARDGTSSTSRALYVSISPLPAPAKAGRPPAAGGSGGASAPTTTVPVSGPPAISKLATTATVSDTQSSNWSGYTAYGGPFSAVRGTFTVPSFAGGTGNAAVSEWVGADGADDSSLIQAGVLEQASSVPGGSPQVQPWWEILPAVQTPITSVGVSAGDSVTVTIWKSSGPDWDIEFTDDTTGQHFSTQQPYSGPGQSAEWVVEAPTNGARDQVSTLAAFSPAVAFSGLGTAGVQLRRRHHGASQHRGGRPFQPQRVRFRRRLLRHAVPGSERPGRTVGTGGFPGEGRAHMTSGPTGPGPLSLSF